MRKILGRGLSVAAVLAVLGGIGVATIGSANADEVEEETITVTVRNEGGFVIDFCARSSGKTECSDKFAKGEAESEEITIPKGASVKVGADVDLGTTFSGGNPSPEEEETPNGRNIDCLVEGVFTDAGIKCNVV